MNSDLNPDLTEVLDWCLLLLRQAKTIEDCAARYPQYPEIGQLLRTAVAVQNTVPLTMPVPQADLLEQRLLGQFRDRHSVPPKGRARPVLRLFQTAPVRLLLAACAVMVIFFSGLGISSASANAIPGDNLYGLKRIIEQIDLHLSTSDALRNQAFAHIADQRLYEATLLTLQNKPLDVPFIADTVDTLDVAQRNNLSADVQTLLAQHTSYLSALIKQKPSQSTAMNQFAARLDRFGASSTVIAPEITATVESSATPTAEIVAAPAGTPALIATSTAAASVADTANGQHTPNGKPVHPTQKPMPSQANPNAGASNNGGGNGNGKGH